VLDLLASEDIERVIGSRIDADRRKSSRRSSTNATLLAPSSTGSKARNSWP
jgi:hypothetical protein